MFFLAMTAVGLTVGAATALPHWRGGHGLATDNVTGCQPTLNSGLWSATSPNRAETRALIGWTNVATQEHGGTFAVWHNAIDRRINCAETERGTYQCLLMARPCPPRPVVAEVHPAVY